MSLTSVPGKLLLHSMPGRYESLDSAWAAMKKEGVIALVRLTPIEEVRSKSPSYAAAIKAGTVPFQVLECEIPDFGVPANQAEFLSLTRDIAWRLKSGQVILVHCGAGIGRTGTFAAGVLIALGHRVNIAQKLVSEAGSAAERDEQRKLISWCGAQGSNER